VAVRVPDAIANYFAAQERHDTEATKKYAATMEPQGVFFTFKDGKIAPLATG
jgi:hypothetical protein